MKFSDKNQWIQLESVDSTNNYAQKLIKNDFEHGSLIITDEQTAGRGQGSNNWESEKGKNLLFSILLKPDFLLAEDQFLISKVVSLGIVDFLKSYTESASIKWPNDIYIGEKKIAGILIENRLFTDKISSSIVGIGFNLNQEIFHSDAPNPVSLKNISHKDHNPESSLEQILFAIEKRYKELKNQGRENINSAYLKNMFRLGEFRVFLAEGSVIAGKISGVNQYGQLGIESMEGEIKYFGFGEISFVL